MLFSNDDQGVHEDYPIHCYDERYKVIATWGVAVVEWLRSRPLDRGSRPGQGRNLKMKISASGAPQRW